MDKLKLFDDHDEDQQDQEELINEKIFHNHLSEKQTSKIIKLKSRFNQQQQDSRFKIDERFIDDDNDDDDVYYEESITNKSEIENEKDQNLNILEQVIDKRVKKHSTYQAQSLQQQSLFTPRYFADESSSKYEIKSTVNGDKNEVISNKTKKQKVRSIDFEEIDSKIKRRKYQESNECDEKSEIKNNENDNQYYYETGTNLKNLFSGGTEDFTIGSALFNDDEINEHEETVIDNADKLSKFLSKSNENQTKNKDNNNDDGEIDEIRFKLGDTNSLMKNHQSKSFCGSFFRLNYGDVNKDQTEEKFFTPELIEKINQTSKQRQLLMIRALSLRKKSSLKNKRTAEKFDLKQKKHKRFILQQQRKRKGKKLHRFKKQFKNK